MTRWFSFLFILLPILTLAQTGPGGIGNKDGENQQPKNIIWLNVENLSLSDGDDIINWPDASGNLNGLSSTSSISPFFENTADLNGFGYSLFDQTARPDSRMFLTSFGEISNQANTSVFVIRTTDQNDAWFSYATNTDNEQLLILNSDDLESYYTNNNSASPGVDVNDGNWHIVLVAGSAATGAVVFKVDGSETIGVVSAGYEVDPDGTIWLGHQQTTPNSGPVSGAGFDGEIAEVIGYTNFLSAVQRRILTNYLSAKFDIAISNDIYSGDDNGNGDYDFDVAGIGRSLTTIHSIATSAGVTLDDAPGDLDSNGEYLMFGHNGDTPTIIDTPGDVQTGIEQRWNRTWYIDKTTPGILDTRISFDLEAVNGLFPQVADDYVLLRWTGSQYDSVTVGIANKEISGSTIRFNVADGDLVDGRYTLGTTDGTNSPVDGLGNKTWYAYQSGVWSDWQVWTLDGSQAPLLVNPNMETPGPTDNVIVGSGKTIDVDISDFDLKSIEIVGILDVSDQTGINFNAIIGAGVLRLEGNAGVDNFPSGDYASFADGDTGGTLEVYGTGFNISEFVIFNNARLILDSPSDIVVALANARFNGNIEIVQGVLQINDNSSTTYLDINILGDLSISSGGSLEVGSANARHQLNLYGDFNNNGGTANFTNRVATDYTGAEASDGIIDLNLLNISKDQNLLINGPTNFYRIEINKLSITNLVTAIASDPTYFNLFGKADYDHDVTTIDQLIDDPLRPDNQRNLNALGIYRGTFNIGPNIDIPVLSDGASTNYLISKDASIIIAGGSLNKDIGTSITSYGNLSVLTGNLSVLASEGLVLKDQALFRSFGGTSTLNQLTTAQGLGDTFEQGQSLFQTAGDITIIGNGGNTATKNFEFSFESNVIILSGGTLTINGGDQATSNGVLINSSADRVTASGGNVYFVLDQPGVFEISSTVELWNVDLVDSDGTGGNEFELQTSFAVDADFSITNSPNNAVLNANANDLLVGRTLTIGDGASYTTAGNNTIFTGSLNGELIMGTTSTQTFDGFDVAKDDELATVEINAGNATVAVQVDDELRIESGNLDYNSFIVEAKSSLYVADSLGNDGSTGKLVINGAAAQNITSSGGTLFTVDLDNANGTNSLGLSLTGDLKVAGVLTLINGVFDINSSKLTLDGASADIVDSDGINNDDVDDFSSSLMIRTNGLASDGGLEWFLDNSYNTVDVIFPVGTDYDDPSDSYTKTPAQRYTPLVANLQSIDASGGYLRLAVADGAVPFLKAAKSDEATSYYWRIKPSGFVTTPDVVQYDMYTNATDCQGNANNDLKNWYSIKSVGGNRINEDTKWSNGDLVITFDGDFGAGASPFPLEDGSYLAGFKFTGNPLTYYTYRTATTDGAVLDWSESSSNGGWTTTPGSYTNAGNKSPEEGDIAIIYSDGLYWHRVATEDNLEVVELQFDNSNGTPNNNLPQLDILSDNTIILNEVAGVGHIRVRVDPGDNELPDITGDLEDVLAQPNSIFEYNATNEALVGGTAPTVDPGTVIDLFTNYTNYPNLFIGADAEYDAGGFTGEFPMRFTEDITASYLTIYNGGYLQTNSGANGNIEVINDMNIGEGTDETILEYNGDGNARTITVNGNLGITANAAIEVEAGTTNIEHFVRVAQNVNKDNTRFFRSTNLSAQAFVTWELFGTGDHTFSNTVLDEVSFARILMNKGVDTTSTFTINTDFTLTGDNTDAALQVLELQDGLLYVNNSSIDIVLSNSGGEIEIPSSAGLDLQSGTLRTEGASGFRLDGLLRISGGTIDTQNGNSASTGYIRSSNTGFAKFEITSGTLNLAGSLRRDIESNTMVIDYKQLGGTVNIGLNSAGILKSKGVFEVLGLNSKFVYTGGSLIIVHSNGSQLIPSLNITAGTSTITQDIQLGSIATVDAGFQRSFGLNSTITLGGLILNNQGLNPDALVLSSSLELAGSIELMSETIFDLNDKTLIIGGDMIDDGQYIPKFGLTSFVSEAAQQITGASATTFYNINKDGTGTLTLAKNITVTKDLGIQDGVLFDDGFSVSLIGDLTVIGDHTSNGGSGIIMEGSAKQFLNGNSGGISDLGVLTINNNLGVEVPANGYNFLIEDELRLISGVFDIGGSLLVLNTFATIEAISPFGLTNMIKTNNSFTDNGVQKNFPSNWTNDFTFPIGESEYNPVSFDFGSPGNSAGTTAGSLLVRPASEPHPSVTGTDTAPTNADNVLQFYWVLGGTTLTGFTANVTFQYNDSQVSNADPMYDETDYIGARYLSDNNPTNTVNKLGDIVDETNNLIVLSLSGVADDGISGDYFAGVDPAIQSAVAEYTTIAPGDVEDAIYTPVVPGGGAPVGAIVNVEHSVNFRNNNINFYATDLRATGEIIVIESFNHRLGDVTGTGKLNLQSNVSNVVLPAGQFTEFFSPTGGTLEYSGTGNYNVLGGVNAVRFLNLIGSNTPGESARILGSNALTVYEDMTIAGAYFSNPNDLAIDINNDLNITSGSYTHGTTGASQIDGDLNISGGTFDGNSGGTKIIDGNITISGGTLDVGTGGAVAVRGNLTLSGSGVFDGGINQSGFTFLGSTSQQITGSFTGTNSFTNVEVFTSGDVTLNDDVEIDGEISFINGLIYPGINKLLITSTGTTLPFVGSPDSYVSGKLYKDLANGESFTFPIGGGGLWRYAGVTNTTGGAFQWSAEYFRSSADTTAEVDNLTPISPVININDGEHWRISNNSTGGGGEVRLSWVTESNVSPDKAVREKLVALVWDDANSEWDNLGGTNFSAGHTEDQGDFYSVLTADFDDRIFTLGSTDANNPLPVELIYFRGRRNPEGINLSWQTASELNNDYFEVEVSEDAENFRTLARITGAGTSSSLNNYEWLHQSPYLGLNYYRLKQTDFNGAVEYSDVIIVDNDVEISLFVSAYPQPASETVNLNIISSDYENQMQLLIINTSGKVIEKIDLSADQRDLTLDISAYNNGLYLIHLGQSSEIYNGKLLIQH